MRRPTHYEVLRIWPTAPQELVFRAYRVALAALSPDASPEERALLEVAINTLGDKGRRVRYDLWLEDNGPAKMDLPPHIEAEARKAALASAAAMFHEPFVCGSFFRLAPPRVWAGAAPLPEDHPDMAWSDEVYVAASADEIFVLATGEMAYSLARVDPLFVLSRAGGFQSSPAGWVLHVGLLHTSLVLRHDGTARKLKLVPSAAEFNAVLSVLGDSESRLKPVSAAAKRVVQAARNTRDAWRQVRD